MAVAMMTSCNTALLRSSNAKVAPQSRSIVGLPVLTRPAAPVARRSAVVTRAGVRDPHPFGHTSGDFFMRGAAYVRSFNLFP